jgi:hypothetical protein
MPIVYIHFPQVYVYFLRAYIRFLLKPEQPEAEKNRETGKIVQRQAAKVAIPPFFKYNIKCISMLRKKHI